MDLNSVIFLVISTVFTVKQGLQTIWYLYKTTRTFEHR